MVFSMAKLRTKKELPHMFTEKLEHFVEIEDYIKRLETENMIMRMMIPNFNLSELKDVPIDDLIIDKES